MTKAAKNFNEVYKLDVSDASFEKVNISKREKVSKISGKPTTNFKDFLKRFFTKPVYVAALIVFLAILAMAIIAPLVSQHKANHIISQGVEPKLQIWLPDKAHPVIQKALSVAEYKTYINNITYISDIFKCYS